MKDKRQLLKEKIDKTREFLKYLDDIEKQKNPVDNLYVTKSRNTKRS